MTPHYKALTWDHPRGYHALRDAAAEVAPGQGLSIRWDKQPLEGFESHPIADLCANYDLVDDPQIKHNGTFVEYDHPTEGHVRVPGFPIKFSKTPSKIERGAPLTGQHTRDVLLEAGYDDAAIEKLLAAGAVLAQS